MLRHRRYESEVFEDLLSGTSEPEAQKQFVNIFLSRELRSRVCVGWGGVARRGLPESLNPFQGNARPLLSFVTSVSFISRLERKIPFLCYVGSDSEVVL